MRIGCHVSIAGGIQKASLRAKDLGCEVVQIFTRSPQGGKAKEISLAEASDFKKFNQQAGIFAVYTHAPYYINFASSNNRIRYGSASIIRAELERSSLIGARYLMTHLGTVRELGEREANEKIVAMLKKSLDGYTGSTKLLLENSAGAGQIIGDDLKELRYIIDEVNDQNIAGICLDTQHSWASGYDWRDFEKTVVKIEKEIGWEKIKLFHCNDSKTDFNSKKDRHEHIGKGKIGLEAFEKIVALAEKNAIDMILETEYDAVSDDIKLIKKMRLIISKHT